MHAATARARLTRIEEGNEKKGRKSKEDLKKGKLTRAKCVHMSPVKPTDVHVRYAAELFFETGGARERQANLDSHET